MRPSSCVAKYLVITHIYLRRVRQLRSLRRSFSRLHLSFTMLLEVPAILKVLSPQPSAFWDPRLCFFVRKIMASIVQLVPNYPQFVIVVAYRLDDLMDYPGCLHLRLNFAERLFKWRRYHVHYAYYHCAKSHVAIRKSAT